ncbi:MAG: glycosyltransferase family 4 protein [Flavobacteriales bacterium]
MKILQLCHKPPKPTIDGGCIAMNNITQGLLNAGHNLKILTIGTHKHPFQPESLSSEYKKKTRIESVFVDTRINLVDAFSNLVTSDSYNISRFFSTDFDILLTKTLEEEKFDIIHLESLFMTPYLHTVRRLSRAKVVLRSHNLEYMIWKRMAVGTTNPAKRIYLNILANQLKTYEENILKDIDAIAAISAEDTKRYANMNIKKPLISLPFGIDINNYNPTEKTPTSTIKFFHIGAMDWKPNIEGVSWFLEEIWPAMLKENPNIELHLAGRNMPNWMDNLNQKGVFIHGEVSDAKTFMNKYDIMIVPILSAGGMRVKIIEGMAMKKAIISTQIGAEGIEYKNGTHILIADTVEEFVSTLKNIESHPNRINNMGENARELVIDKYDNAALTLKLISFYESLQK